MPRGTYSKRHLPCPLQQHYHLTTTNTNYYYYCYYYYYLPTYHHHHLHCEFLTGPFTGDQTPKVCHKPLGIAGIFTGRMSFLSPNQQCLSLSLIISKEQNHHSQTVTTLQPNYLFLGFRLSTPIFQSHHRLCQVLQRSPQENLCGQLKRDYYWTENAISDAHPTASKC